MSEEKTPLTLRRSIATGLSLGLLLLVLATAMVTIVIPKVAGGVPLTVLTTSMKPHLPPGTLLVVRPEPVDRIHLGDVVTYEPNPNDPTVISHRVVGITTSSDGSRVFTVKGDNNAEADPPVKAKQVKAVLWYSVPYLGWVNNAVNGSWRHTVIPVAAGACFLYAGWMILRALLGGVRRRRAAQV